MTLSTTADMMTEADASVVFTLGDATNEPYSLGTPATVTVTVLDDTSASDEITLSVAPATVDEDAGATTVTVTATLNRAALTSATDVALSVAAGTATETTDYTATTATLTIAANARSGTETITLTPVNDTITEPDETVTVEGTATGFTVIGTEVSILDTDEPAITLSFVGVSSNSIFAGEENGPLEIALKAVAAAAPTRDVLVRVHLVEREGNASVETGDFKPFDKTYTFIATDFASVTEGWVQTVSADLELIDDETVEKIETVEVHVDTASLARHVAAPDAVEVFITDNDTATVGFAATSYQVEEADEIVIGMTTSAPIAFSWSVTVSTLELEGFSLTQIPSEQQAGFTAERAKVQAYATSDDDYYHLTDVIHTAAFETNEITVGTVDDVIDDDDEALLIVMVSNGLDEAITINPKYAFVTIVDDDELPGAPTGLMVDNAGPTTVTLSWTAPSDQGSHTITGYLVEHATNTDDPWVPTLLNDLTAYTNTGLTPERTYHYRVSAVTAAGTGPSSTPVTVTTPALPVIDISADTVNPMQGTSVFESNPAIFRVRRAGDMSEAITVNVEWKQDDSAVTEDTLDIGAESVFGVYVVGARDNAVDEPDGSITVTLKAGTGYTLGTDVSETVIVLDDDDVPGTPVLSARPDNELIELTWPKPAPGTSDITRYDYRRSDNNGVTWSDWTDTEVDLAQTMFSLTFENLVNGTLYSFDVRAVSDAGESEPSNIATATPSTGPTITAIEILSTPSLCDGRAYAQSEEVRIGVTFSEAVSVDATDGEPYLSLRMEGYDANAPYKEGSGTTQLVFARTVVVNGWSGLGKSFAVDDPGAQSGRGLQLNGATIRSTANGNTAVLTGRSLGRTNNAHMIGVVMTGATVTSSPALEETYAKGERLTLTADFNAPIGAHNGPNSKLVLAFDSGPREAEYSHYSHNKVHYGYTITEGDADANGVGIPKDALNLNGAMFGVSGAAFNYVPCNTAIEALSTDKVDAAGPTLLTSAPNEPQTSVDGTKVVLHFDEMVSMTTAEPGAFTVTVDGTERGIDTVMADGVQVWLMLASAVATGEPVRVSYTDPSSADDDGAIQDKLSNDAPSFANQAVTNKVPASGAPGKPTGVTATATPTTVTVSWTAPTDPGTSALTGYAVEWATNENGPWSTATADTGSTTASYTHTGRTPETSYHYRVAAINDSGAGERSESASATTPAAPIITIAGTTGSVVEGTFANFTLTRSGDTSEELVVRLNSTQDGNFVSPGRLSELFPYPIETFTTTKALSLPTTDDALDEPDGSVTVKLLPGTGYTLGTETSATITVTDDDDPPGAPTLAVTPGNAQAALAWTAPSDTGSETISGYDYRVSDDATLTWDPDWTAIADSAPGETNAASYTVSTGLTNGTAYTFELRARNAIGAGPPSAQITITPSTTVNNAPAFPATETGMRTVVENTAAETAIGAAVAASDPDTADTVTYTHWADRHDRIALHHRLDERAAQGGLERVRLRGARRRRRQQPLPGDGHRIGRQRGERGAARDHRGDRRGERQVRRHHVDPGRLPLERTHLHHRRDDRSHRHVQRGGDGRHHRRDAVNRHRCRGRQERDLQERIGNGGARVRLRGRLEYGQRAAGGSRSPQTPSRSIAERSRTPTTTTRSSGTAVSQETETTGSETSCDWSGSPSTRSRRATSTGKGVTLRLLGGIQPRGVRERAAVGTTSRSGYGSAGLTRTLQRFGTNRNGQQIRHLRQPRHRTQRGRQRRDRGAREHAERTGCATGATCSHSSSATAHGQATRRFGSTASTRGLQAAIRRSPRATERRSSSPSPRRCYRRPRQPLTSPSP